jgi:putative toxin-antitoxin system antitoxin component (TIGR02293 family)
MRNSSQEDRKSYSALEEQVSRWAEAMAVRESNAGYGLRAEMLSAGMWPKKMEMLRAIRQGIPYAVFERIHQLAPFSNKDWSNFLHLTERSLLRYRVNKKIFQLPHSETIIEMAEISGLGMAVFGNPGKLRLWLDTPAFSLAGEKPIDLLNTSYGKELVIGELTRIEYGIFS